MPPRSGSALVLRNQGMEVGEAPLTNISKIYLELLLPCPQLSVLKFVGLGFQGWKASIR